MGRFRLLWLSLFILFYFILFHCSRCSYTISSTARRKKVGVIYIDILRLTHCQVVEELRAGGCEVQKLQITWLVAVKTLKQGTDDGEIAT